MELIMTMFKYLKITLCFIFTFLAIALAFGTFIMQLLVKSLAIYIRQTGWMLDNENTIIIGILIFFTLFLLLISKWLTKWFIGTENKKARFKFVVVLLVLYALSIGYWLMPKEIAQDKVMVVSRDGRFIGGPYPDRLMMSKLKGENYTAVISLLDPLMLPSEPGLIREEQESAQEAGIPLIRIPMLPGDVNNQVAENQIAELVKHKDNNKYYVHAYYGHDRLVTFMNWVNRFLPAIKVAKKTLAAQTTQAVVINTPQNQTLSLERGKAIKLDNHLIVAPKLTDSEYVNLITNNKNTMIGLHIQSIVSINADDAANTQTDLIKLLNSSGIKFYSMPISLYPYDPDKVLNVVKKVKSLSGGVLIYSYFMPPQSTVMTGFILSYLTNLPALPKGLFTSEPMAQGGVNVIAPNIAIGPRPTDAEFGNYLQPRGIKSIAYIGACNGSDYNNDAQSARAIHMTWACFSSTSDMLYKSLSENGPWYVYGPDLSKIQMELIQHFSKLNAETASAYGL